MEPTWNIRVLGLLRPYRTRILGLLVLIVLAALAEGLGLVLLSALLNFLVEPSRTLAGSGRSSFVAEFAQGSPRMFLLALGVTYVSKSLLALWATFGSFSLALRMTDDWRARLIRAFFHTPVSRLDKQQGAMLQLVLDEPSSIGIGLGATGLLAQNALSALTVYVVLMQISPVIAAGLTLMALAAMATVGLLSRYSREIAARRSLAFSHGYAYLSEMLSAIKQLRLFDLEAQAESRAAVHLEKMRGLQRTSNVLASSPRLLIEVVFLLGLALLLLVLIPQVGERSVLPEIGLAVAAALRLLPSFSASAGTWVLIQQAWPALQRMTREMTSLERDATEGRNAASHAQLSFSDRIVLDNVSFSYPGRDGVLTKVSLEIPCGAFTAIVGPSGSGKSTLVDLLCGFYRPDSGAILVDGVDLQQLAPSHWRRQLGVVSQDAFLLSGTIRDNLCLLRPDCPEDLLRSVVELVGASRFIRDLPEGYETRLGERGVSLSGGQRQRLALARVLVREPRLLILDEATSALDVESEEVLQRGLEQLRGRLTMVVIAHRLSTVRRADRIYVMDAGTVVESGHHDALMELDGYYAAMRRTAEMGMAR